LSKKTFKNILNDRIGFEFFSKSRKRSEILQSTTMNRKKAPEIINKVLCEQERLVETLQNNKFFIFIEENIRYNWQVDDFLLRYIDPQILELESIWINSFGVYASDCSIEKLFTTFRNVMWKKTNSVSKHSRFFLW